MSAVPFTEEILNEKLQFLCRVWRELIGKFEVKTLEYAQSLKWDKSLHSKKQRFVWI